MLKLYNDNMHKYKLIRWIIALFLFITITTCGKNTPQFREGDIIFQISKSSQSQAIQLATHSQYSHMGIIFFNDNKPYVYEAAKLVELTPLKEWVKRGVDGKYVIKRLKNDKSLTADTLKKMKTVGQQFKGKKYDIYFKWDDKEMYCSELVYKIYKEGANIELGKLERFKDFDLSHPLVKQKMKERFGDNIPYNEIVISPKSIFEDEKLREIYSN